MSSTTQTRADARTNRATEKEHATVISSASIATALRRRTHVDDGADFRTELSDEQCAAVYAATNSGLFSSSFEPRSSLRGRAARATLETNVAAVTEVLEEMERRGGVLKVRRMMANSKVGNVIHTAKAKQLKPFQAKVKVIMPRGQDAVMRAKKSSEVALGAVSVQRFEVLGFSGTPTFDKKTETSGTEHATERAKAAVLSLAEYLLQYVPRGELDFGKTGVYEGEAENDVKFTVSVEPQYLAPGVISIRARMIFTSGVFRVNDVYAIPLNGYGFMLGAEMAGKAQVAGKAHYDYTRVITVFIGGLHVVSQQARALRAGGGIDFALTQLGNELVAIVGDAGRTVNSANLWSGIPPVCYTSLTFFQSRSRMRVQIVEEQDVAHPLGLETDHLARTGLDPSHPLRDAHWRTTARVNPSILVAANAFYRGVGMELWGYSDSRTTSALRQWLANHLTLVTTDAGTVMKPALADDPLEQEINVDRIVAALEVSTKFQQVVRNARLGSETIRVGLLYPKTNVEFSQVPPMLVPTAGEEARLFVSGISGGAMRYFDTYVPDPANNGKSISAWKLLSRFRQKGSFSNATEFERYAYIDPDDVARPRALGTLEEGFLLEEKVANGVQYVGYGSQCIDISAVVYGIANRLHERRSQGLDISQAMCRTFFGTIGVVAHISESDEGRADAVYGCVVSPSSRSSSVTQEHATIPGSSRNVAGRVVRRIAGALHSEVSDSCELYLNALRGEE
uniref:Uncharacterized protein n=1 Tax=viral metagenome TaxID=1070528 RepID=A0A2V0RA66_9ZZZZ